MAVYPFLGMRGTGDWTDPTARPGSYREKILELWPNGSAPLTAITSKTGRGQKLTDSKYTWKTRTLATQAGAVTAVYIDVSLVTAYVYATHQATIGIAGGTVHAKVAAATAAMFREGHKVILRDSNHLEVDVRGKVVGVIINGASSVISVKLHEADDNGSVAASFNLATVDRIMVIGNINSQCGTRPRALRYDPVDVYNVTQIWRTPVELSGTALETTLRGRDAYIDEKQQGLLYHGIEMEKDLIWSVRTEGTGANGKPENSIMGIIQFITTYVPASVDDFSLNSDYIGKTWKEAGKNWLDAMIQTIYAVGSGELGSEVLALCGGGAAAGIQQLVEANSMYTITEKTAAYGVRVLELRSIFGTIFLKIHPLLNFETTNAHTMLLVPPAAVRWLPLRDTHYKPDMLYDQGGAQGVDGKQEEYLTEGTYEYMLDGPWGYLKGVGMDNAA